MDVSSSIKWRCAKYQLSERPLSFGEWVVWCETTRVRLLLTAGVFAAYFKRRIMVGVWSWIEQSHGALAPCEDVKKKWRKSPSFPRNTIPLPIIFVWGERLRGELDTQRACNIFRRSLSIEKILSRTWKKIVQDAEEFHQLLYQQYVAGKFGSSQGFCERFFKSFEHRKFHGTSDGMWAANFRSCIEQYVCEQRGK